MLNRPQLKINYFKINKFRNEQGTKIFLKKLLFSTKKKIFGSSQKRTLNLRNFLLGSINQNSALNDIEDFFSKGLFRSPDKIRSDWKSLPVEIGESLISEAGNILKHKFILYGNQELHYDPKYFSWVNDPLNDFVWPHNLTTNYFSGQKPYGIDIKTIWELARFQFLSSLAYAYVLENDERYAYFALDKVNSWIDENPFMKGPHWLIPMEASIRLINWCVYLPLLDINKFKNEHFFNNFKQSILEHFIYIRENLETSLSQEGNHYLSNLLGLLLAKSVFPSINWASEIYQFAKKEFLKEIFKQFDKSGINFEGSLPYHRLSTEMLLIGTALIKRFRENLPQFINNHIKQNAIFTQYYTDTSDECPIIGDNDSSVFIRFFPGQECNQHGYLKGLFDAILEDDNKPIQYRDYLCSIHFKDTKQPVKSANVRLGKNSNNLLQVKEFGGLVIARHDTDAIFFNTIHSTQGHAHNDKLSLYPVFRRKLLFIDCGTYSYTGFPDKRFEDRMTSSHNCPVINDWEQNSIWENESFFNNGEAKCFNIMENESNTLNITGWHIGYDRFRKSLKIFRRVIWDTCQRTISITDWAEGPLNHESFRFSWNFMINPLWFCTIRNKEIIMENKEQKVCFSNSEEIPFRLENGTYSKSYQMKTPCKIIRAFLETGVGNKIHFILRY